MATIHVVEQNTNPDAYVFHVAVRENNAETNHVVTLKRRTTIVSQVPLHQRSWFAKHSSFYWSANRKKPFSNGSTSRPFRVIFQNLKTKFTNGFRMPSFLATFFIFLHTLIAWVGVEVYINSFHPLPRFWFVFWHYAVVFVLFSIVFTFYFRFFSEPSVFATALVGLASILLIEIVVFRFFYSGELWFLNYVDWIVPVFLAVSAIYLAGYINR